uniref:Uncharacterized protein n=1 Tax=Arundo donax TaxID=35708 RepID=A0A0A9GX13_ARUDO
MYASRSTENSSHFFSFSFLTRAVGLT